MFESKKGADELQERGQGGGRFFEAKKSEKRPFAIELRHLARGGRVCREVNIKKNLVVPLNHHGHGVPHAGVLAVSSNRLSTVAQATLNVKG